jgi:hypothetical protein
MAAVGGLHLDTSNGRPVEEGTLAEGAIEVVLGETVLIDGIRDIFPVGQDLPIAVVGTQIPYRGVLVRIEAPAGVDTTLALTPGENTKVADVCIAPVVGITQPDRSDKTLSTGTVRFDEEALDVQMDITVVFINEALGSAYSYGQFRVDFRADTTLAPVAAPVGAPIAVPTPATSAPVPAVPTAPTPSPTFFPTGTIFPTAQTLFPTYHKYPPRPRPKGKGRGMMKSKKGKGRYSKRGMMMGKGKGGKGGMGYGNGRCYRGGRNYRDRCACIGGGIFEKNNGRGRRRFYRKRQGY